MRGVAGRSCSVFNAGAAAAELVNVVWQSASWGRSHNSRRNATAPSGTSANTFARPAVCKRTKPHTLCTDSSRRQRGGRQLFQS